MPSYFPGGVDSRRIAAACTECAGLVVANVDAVRPDRVLDYQPRTLAGKSFPDVPPAIASAANEAHLCLSAGGPRGAVALARAVIEATAKFKGIVTGKLESKIDALATQGFIREHTREAAHEVRHYGNEVAHGDLVDDPVSPAEAAEVLVLMDLILQEVFQELAQIQKLREAREKRLRGEGVTSDESAHQQAAWPDLGQGKRVNFDSGIR